MYEEAQGDEFDNLYVHHDIMLPAFPLALAWMDCNPAATAADPAASKGGPAQIRLPSGVCILASTAGPYLLIYARRTRPRVDFCMPRHKQNASTFINHEGIGRSDATKHPDGSNGRFRRRAL